MELCTFKQEMVHKGIVKLSKVCWEQLYSLYTSLSHALNNWYTLSGGWSSSVHAHIHLQRRWYSQLGTACLQVTSDDEQVLTPALLRCVSTSHQNPNHPCSHPPWTWDGGQPHNVRNMRLDHKLVNIMLCRSRQRHTFSMLYYCIVYTQ